MEHNENKRLSLRVKYDPKKSNIPDIPCEESSHFDVTNILKKIDEKEANSAPRVSSGN